MAWTEYLVSCCGFVPLLFVEPHPAALLDIYQGDCQGYVFIIPIVL